MIYNISQLDMHLQKAIEEFSLFSLKKDGITVKAVPSTSNYTQKEGNVLTIYYTNTAKLIYSLFLFDSVNFIGKTDCKFVSVMAMVDMSRNAVGKVSSVKKLMRHLVLMGYTDLQLYMEDVYEIPEEPYFGYKRGRYSQEELKEIVAYSKKIGLSVFPAIQTLAHLNGIARWSTYHEIIDFADILLVGEERTYTLIENMLRSLKECFGCEKINLGLDEAHMLGLGKYLDKHGYTKRIDILAEHIQKVCSIAEKYGFTKPMVWSDMFFRLVSNGAYASVKELPEEVLNLAPENLTMLGWNYYFLDSKYYENMLNLYKKFNRPICYAGGANSWHGVTPMNGFAMKQTKAVIEGCKRANVSNYMFTIWGDDGAECSVFACLPSLAYAGALTNGRRDYKKLFEKMTGITFDKFLRLDLNNEVVEKCHMVTAPSKYMLYNDCLLGLMDCTVNEGDGEKYVGIARKLNTLTKNNEWGYLFRTQEKLAKVLAIKYELGVKTRKAYLAKDKQAIKCLIDNEYKQLLKRIDEFYVAFEEQWFNDNKSYGFDIQDLRLGGLKQRIVHVKKILNDYVSGKIDKIEELEEGVLNVFCDENLNGKGVDIRGHRHMFSASILSHV
ncbi:MAG: beta-N-acetylhexosaminidase [Clostridia bacterium]|nr:beta-N-acetylhexosaminidase [Clostridia bacterium]